MRASINIQTSRNTLVIDLQNFYERLRIGYFCHDPIQSARIVTPSQTKISTRTNAFCNDRQIVWRCRQANNTPNRSSRKRCAEQRARSWRVPYVHANEHEASSRRGSERCHHRVISQQIGLYNAGRRGRERERNGEREKERERWEEGGTDSHEARYSRGLLVGWTHRATYITGKLPPRLLFSITRRFLKISHVRSNSKRLSKDRRSSELDRRQVSETIQMTRCRNIARRACNNAHYSWNATSYPKRGPRAPWTDSMDSPILWNGRPGTEGGEPAL